MREDDLESIQRANISNSTKLRELEERFQNLALVAQYSMYIYPSAKARNARREPRDVVRMERRLCIWDMAMRLVVFYFRMSEPMEYLRSVAESLRVVYLVAMALANMLDIASERKKTAESTESILADKYPVHIMIEDNKSRLEAIEHHITHVTRRHYESLTRLEEANEEEDLQNEDEVNAEAEGLLNMDILDTPLL